MRSLLVLLLVVPIMVQAEHWVLLGLSDQSDEIYVAKGTIKRNGNFRKFWGRLDFSKRQPSGALSVRYWGEVDCDQERFRLLEYTSFFNSALSGDVLTHGKSSSEWSQIAPGTMRSEEFRYVCSQ
jgi:hypothetical protein